MLKNTSMNDHLLNTSKPSAAAAMFAQIPEITRHHDIGATSSNCIIAVYANTYVEFNQRIIVYKNALSAYHTDILYRL